jgi:hypothetical protein
VNRNENRKKRGRGKPPHKNKERKNPGIKGGEGAREGSEQIHV